jgi:CheY-like chemotaxis protein
VKPIDLNGEIRRIEKLINRILPKMIDIKVLLADDLNIINADPSQIEQVVLNLAINAHHAMPEGGRLIITTNNVTIRYDGSYEAGDIQPGDYVLLNVSDTGTGIEPGIKDRIFEPFFTTKKDTHGTGLGLSMVHGIVEQHKGHIRCYSKPGVGTAFKIYFPTVQKESAGDTASTSDMPEIGNETILLVDDEIRIRNLAGEMLMLAGYDVMGASDGAEAIEVYRDRQDHISLVILDLIMPGMSGSQCLRELIKINPEVKVLISSGYSGDISTHDVTAAGAHGFITKPYDLRELLTAIRKILDQDT